MFSLAGVLVLALASKELCGSRADVVDSAFELAMTQLETVKKAEAELAACHGRRNGSCAVQEFVVRDERRRMEFHVNDVRQAIRKLKAACEDGS